jgi:hypothetical protein
VDCLKLASQLRSGAELFFAEYALGLRLGQSQMQSIGEITCEHIAKRFTARSRFFTSEALATFYFAFS